MALFMLAQFYSTISLSSASALSPLSSRISIIMSQEELVTQLDPSHLRGAERVYREHFVLGEGT